MWNAMKSKLLALHRDEQGADMVEYILIVAAIGLPLLGVVVYFWKDIKEWVWGQTNEIKADVEAGSGGG